MKKSSCRGILDFSMASEHGPSLRYTRAESTYHGLNQMSGGGETTELACLYPLLKACRTTSSVTSAALCDYQQLIIPYMHRRSPRLINLMLYVSLYFVGKYIELLN